VRRIIQWALVPAAVAAVACKGTPRTKTSMSDDLKRDLQMASATQNLRISPDEIAPQSHQELALKPKKAPNGPKVVRSEHPTKKASVTPVESAPIKAKMPQVQVMASAPEPSETSSGAPPLARPSPVPAVGYPGAGQMPGDGAGGSGGVLGGIWGAVMRGGIDDDHCDPRGGARRPRNGGAGIGGDVVGTIIGGMIGGGAYPGRVRPRY